MYICLCHAVTERQVRECVRDGARSLDDLARKLGVGTCCGRCRESARALLAEADPSPATLLPCAA